MGRSLRVGRSTASPHFAALRSGLSVAIPNAEKIQMSINLFKINNHF